MTSASLTPRPHIAHVFPYVNVGGTEISQLRAAEAAASLGFRNTLFYRSDAPLVHDLCAGTGFDVRAFDPVEPSYRSAAFARHTLRLASQLRREGISLVHSAEFLGALYVGYAARLAGAALLAHVRNRFEHITRRDRTFLLPVQRFAFVSEYTRRGFAHKVSPHRGRVIYEGIDVDAARSAPGSRMRLRQEFGISERAPLVGMIARVAPQKDFATLVRAAREVVKIHPEVRFLIVGDHSTTEVNRQAYGELLAQIQNAGLSEQFVFTGHRPDVHDILGALDVFALCSHWEGMPVVLLEAMAHALPVVATAVDGVPELIVDGEVGLLFPHEDAPMLAAHLNTLLTDRQGARSMGDAAKAHVIKHFARERFTDEIGRLYAEMHHISAATRIAQAPPPPTWDPIPVARRSDQELRSTPGS